MQIDSVNVVVRSHYLPAFSRLGAYEPGVLERAAYGRDRMLFEYWGHEASLLPVEFQPCFAGAWSGRAAGSAPGVTSRSSFVTSRSCSSACARGSPAEDR